MLHTMFTPQSLKISPHCSQRPQPLFLLYPEQKTCRRATNFKTRKYLVNIKYHYLKGVSVLSLLSLFHATALRTQNKY